VFVTLAADEAVILLQFVVGGFVALRLAWHGCDFSLLTMWLAVNPHLAKEARCGAPWPGKF
jgi:hypothetical protein